MELKDVNLSTIASGIGAVGALASIVNPAIGGSMVLAGKALQTFNAVGDDALENNVYGLGAMAKDIETMVDTDSVDYDKLTLIAKELHNISVASQKVSKMFA